MFYSAGAQQERFWRVGIARNAVFFCSFEFRILAKSSEKRGGAEDRLPKTSTKFTPRLRARAIWKPKPLKHYGLGAFLEAQNLFRLAGAGGFETLQNTWQAQGFVRGAKTLASVVDLKRIRNDAFGPAAARIRVCDVNV